MGKLGICVVAVLALACGFVMGSRSCAVRHTYASKAHKTVSVTEINVPAEARQIPDEASPETIDWILRYMRSHPDWYVYEQGGIFAEHRPSMAKYTVDGVWCRATIKFPDPAWVRFPGQGSLTSAPLYQAMVRDQQVAILLLSAGEEKVDLPVVEDLEDPQTVKRFGSFLLTGASGLGISVEEWGPAVERTRTGPVLANTLRSLIGIIDLMPNDGDEPDWLSMMPEGAVASAGSLTVVKVRSELYRVSGYLNPGVPGVIRLVVDHPDFGEIQPCDTHECVGWSIDPETFFPFESDLHMDERQLRVPLEVRVVFEPDPIAGEGFELSRGVLVPGIAQ